MIGCCLARPADLAFLALFGALFLACFLLHLGGLSRGGFAWIPVHVSAGESGPVVQGFWMGSEAERSGLSPGDRLLSVGEADLAGSGVLGFVARVYEQAGEGRSLSLRYERDGHGHETRLELVPVPYAWRNSAVALAFAAIGAVAFWRARASRASRSFFLASLFYALHWCYFWGGSLAQTYAALAVFLVAPSLAAPLALRTILQFPEEVARPGRAAALAPWLFAGSGLFVTTFAFGFPLPPALGQPLGIGSNVLFIAVVLAVLAQSYRRASALGRRQLRWVLFGFYAGLAPAALAGALRARRPAALVALRDRARGRDRDSRSVC